MNQLSTIRHNRVLIVFFITFKDRYIKPNLFLIRKKELSPNNKYCRNIKIVTFQKSIFIKQNKEEDFYRIEKCNNKQGIH